MRKTAHSLAPVLRALPRRSTSLLGTAATISLLCGIAAVGCRTPPGPTTPPPPLPLPAARPSSWCVILCVADQHSWMTKRLDPWVAAIPNLHRLFLQELGTTPDQIVEWRNPDARRFLQALDALSRRPMQGPVVLYLAAHHRRGRVLMNRGSAIPDAHLKRAINAVRGLRWFLFDACYAAEIENVRPAFRRDIVRWYAAAATERAAGFDQRYRNRRLERLLEASGVRLPRSGTSWFSILLIAGVHRLRAEGSRGIDLGAWFSEMQSMAVAVRRSRVGTDLPVPVQRGPEDAAFDPSIRLPSDFQPRARRDQRNIPQPGNRPVIGN